MEKSGKDQWVDEDEYGVNKGTPTNICDWLPVVLVAIVVLIVKFA